MKTILYATDYKTIVYATDYSQNSAAALKYARKLMGQMNTRLVVTHVFDYPTVLGTEMLSKPFPNVEKDVLKINQTKLEVFYEEHLGSSWEESFIQLQAVQGKSVIDGIISVADQWHASLIVLGMKGGSILQELILGSTTQKLIKKAPCPVLAVPSDIRHFEIRTMVYATDFEEADLQALKKLVKIAKPFNAQIKVVHISTGKEYAGDDQMEWFKAMLEEMVSYNKIEFKLFFSNDIFQSLCLYLDEVDADVLVMLEQEDKSILKKWFGQDLVKKMENYGKLPLLSFRQANL